MGLKSAIRNKTKESPRTSSYVRQIRQADIVQFTDVYLIQHKSLCAVIFSEGGGGSKQLCQLPLLILVHQYDALIGDRRAGVEAPSCERGVHVRTCRCTPHLTCVSLLSNGPLAAHQVQTQSAQQFARYLKRVCTCARADAIHPDLCKARIYWAPSHTQNLNAIFPAVCEIWKIGVHVRTCRCTPPQTCVKRLSNGSLATHQI